MNQQQIYETALGELGQQEVPGSKDNPRITEYIKTVKQFEQAGIDPDEDYVAWCSAFIQWCCEQVCLKGTESGYARSWLTWGLPVTEPKIGDIVVLSRGKDKKLGHVGLFVSLYKDPKIKDQVWIKLLGGNQDQKVCIQAYDAGRVLGFRRAIE